MTASEAIFNIAVNIFFVVAFRKSFWGIISPQVADALALRHVVVLALDEGFHSVVLQCD